jgi:predicted metalloprotease
MILAIVGAARAQNDDNWEVVESPPPQQEQPAQPEKAAPPARVAASREAEVIVACGEQAVPASSQVKAIVAEINRVWNSDVKVYQSAAPSGPHARPGGCILYHPAVMASLLNGWMNIKEARTIKPMIYAIFAHEVGHEVHRDFDSTRRSIAPSEIELEADRFAGYTMSYLRIQPDDIESYYRLTGDDFTGGQNSHGSSEQRANAFEHGWKLAEVGSSEQSVIPAAGLGHP